MKIKQLEKATKIFEKIKKLDKEITEFDKLALLIVNNKTNISFELNIETLKDNEETMKFGIDGDGSLTYKLDYTIKDFLPWATRFSAMDIGAISNISKKNANSLKSMLSETPTLQILGILLGEKQRERESLLLQLKSYGIEN